MWLPIILTFFSFAAEPATSSAHPAPPAVLTTAQRETVLRALVALHQAEIERLRAEARGRQAQQILERFQVPGYHLDDDLKYVRNQEPQKEGSK